MRVISPLDLRRSLGAILDAASAGERFLVERDRRPLAMLVSVEDGRRLELDPGEERRRRLDALARLEALAARQSAGPASVVDAAVARSTTPAPASAPAPVPAPPARPAPGPQGRPAPGSAGPPAPASASAGRVDRHDLERRRHEGEDLVGLG